MNASKPSLSAALMAALAAFLFLAPMSARAQEAPAARRIHAYYQQLLPTLQQADRLSVRERDQRFAPAINSAFDLAAMTRYAAGPAWSTFSPSQQAAVREAFARFLVANYASLVRAYSGESFVVEPQTTPEARGGGEVVKTKLIQGEAGPSRSTISSAAAG